MMNNITGKKNLYVEEKESDSCGVGLIASIDNIKTNTIVNDALTILENMLHRGACGCEENTGDGAGILVQIPHAFFKNFAKENKYELPEAGTYGVGFLFISKDVNLATLIHHITKICLDANFKLLFHRIVPTDNSKIGDSALKTEPLMLQIFVKIMDRNSKNLEQNLYVLRAIIEKSVIQILPGLEDDFYFSSFSSKTIVYKGQLIATQVRQYFKDLSDKNFASALAIVHSRFSTNTMPKWKLAQPFRCIAHNGEINTLQSNINWWKAVEKEMKSDVFTGGELAKIFSLTNKKLSDSANLDSVLEFLIQSGFSLPKAVMVMIPEAYQNDELMPEYKKYFYKYYEPIMEAWDGPASICFSNGELVGAVVDRNGLRPSKYIITDDNRVIISSEIGVLPINPENIIEKGVLEPGKIFLADLIKNTIITDAELKSDICKRYDYEKWNKTYSVEINAIKEIPEEVIKSDKNNQKEKLITKQIASGITKEDKEIILKTIIETGYEPVSSMGSDIPLAVLSTQAQNIYNYFKQDFAQVTNPPIDALRESFYMSLVTYLGTSNSILNSEEGVSKNIMLPSPILSNTYFKKIKNVETYGFKNVEIDTVFDSSATINLKSTIDDICIKIKKLIRQGVSIVILNNNKISKKIASIPSLMMVGALHHHLIEAGIRKKCSIVVNGCDIIEPHHFACLISFGANAIYSAVASEMIEEYSIELKQDYKILEKNFIKAIENGLLKIMSKLGISTINSYRGGQTFEALGIHQEVVDICFKGVVSRIGGMTFDMLAKEHLHKHGLAFKKNMQSLIEDGRYQWRHAGEFHLFNPESIHLLQHSTRTNDYSLFKSYSELVNKKSKTACTLRQLFKIKTNNISIPIEDVEPVENILKRFVTGAMSFGSISYEAHTMLALAMNRIGGKSNSGEGGEDSVRYKKLTNGDSLNSAIKQVASARFGVTIEYLNAAEELQIKIAQGAKPGEGGQLPGYKVDKAIARMRYSTEGVTLISPPPHHDIYSIEDLAQLIFDLKNANDKARISVKLVSKAGVGVIASGVAKAKADHILISGFDGGTGASPLSSIMHAGLPWELGLAETHQTLLKNKLRNRVTLQADGQIRTGKDIAIATMLGAEEWGIATGALVVGGCIMMRKCHLNTCPVGIATQNPELRKKFDGKVEHLVNYFTFLAKELREIMASLGFKTVNEMVGRSDLLDYDLLNMHWKYKKLDLSPIVYRSDISNQIAYKNMSQNHGIKDILDIKLIEDTKTAIENNNSFTKNYKIKNTNRTIGTMLSSFIVRKYGAVGISENSIKLNFRGSAGQSFAAFAIKGMQLHLEGESNDYLAKGLSGASVIVIPDRLLKNKGRNNSIVGNVALFGATAGCVYINGCAGERFAVRNSGANAVLEGLGNNGCEYMTGGIVVILGNIGKNFAAGMSGGIAYLYNQDTNLDKKINNEMVFIDTIDETDLYNIKKMIEEHNFYTGSFIAKKILKDWNHEKNNFSKIISKEYKAFLQKELKRTA